jgi:prepilin-type processing-associated H-X9-DG protein
MEREPGRWWWRLPRCIGGPGSEDAAAGLCRSAALPPNSQADGFFPYGWSASNYDHILTPNVHGCVNSPKAIMNRRYMAPPSSLHAGGVNVLLADGHVDFTSDSIDEQAWRGIGTRNGERPKR